MFSVVKSLREFDKIDLAGVLDSVVALPPPGGVVDYRETCFLATYYRTAGLVESFLRLDSAPHFQAAANIARSLFELAVDIKLADRIPGGFLRMVFFVDIEKLHRARKMIEFANAHSDRGIDVSQQAEFVKKNEARIENNRKILWPAPTSGKPRVLKHWSELHISKRVELLGEPFDAMYKFEYPRLSWYVHDGLTGVVNLPAEYFPTVHGYAIALVMRCYTQILECVIRAMKIDRAMEKVHKVLQFATLLPFCKNPEDEERLRSGLLG